MPATDVFNGTYHWVQHRVDRGPPLRGVNIWGTLAANGAGMILGAEGQVISNGIVGPASMPPLPYRILAGNRIQWMFEGNPGAEGGISADGGLSVVSSVLVGGSPSIAVLARREAGLSVASLSGLYHFAQFGTTAAGTSDVTTWGRGTFNGSGDVTFMLWSNRDGVISGPVGGPGTYTVAPDGALTLSMGGTSFGGGVVRGGQLAILGGSADDGGPAALGVLLAYSTAATTTTFNGSYHTMMMTASPDAMPIVNWTTYAGTVLSNGLGTWSWTSLTRMRDDGVITLIPDPTLVPYTVAANGAMTISSGLVGAVSADGSHAAFVGSTAAGSGPALWILIR